MYVLLCTSDLKEYLTYTGGLNGVQLRVLCMESLVRLAWSWSSAATCRFCSPRPCRPLVPGVEAKFRQECDPDLSQPMVPRAACAAAALTMQEQSKRCMDADGTGQ
jgi:hypothetical protein